MKNIMTTIKKGIASIVAAAVVFGIGLGVTRDNALAYNAGIEAFVNSLYADCLGRNADPTGFNDWCNKLATGQITGKQAAYGFFFSPEFQAKANAWSDTELINAYYKVFLNRGSDPSGASYWAQQIAGTTNDISILFTGFADSTEFANKCASYGITVGPHVNVPTTVRTGENTSVVETQTSGINNDFARWALAYATGTDNYPDLMSYWMDNSMSKYNSGPRYPYVMNGLSTTSGIDCSGLNCYIVQQYWGRTDCPHHMWTQATTYGTTIDASQIQPGDLLCDYSDGGVHGWVYFYVGRVETVHRGIAFHQDYMLAGRLSEDGTLYYPEVCQVPSMDGTLESWLAVGNRRVARLG